MVGTDRLQRCVKLMPNVVVIAGPNVAGKSTLEALWNQIKM